jgi:hypothetical protein
MMPLVPDNGESLRRCDTLHEYLLRYGPATAQDLRGILSLSRSATYEVIRRAAKRGLIRAVAHVHSDGNHDPVAWDIDSDDRELLWRRSQRLRGRFCTCLPTPSRGRRAPTT